MLDIVYIYIKLSFNNFYELNYIDTLTSFIISWGFSFVWLSSDACGLLLVSLTPALDFSLLLSVVVHVWLLGLPDARLLWPPLSPRVCSSSCPLSCWCCPRERQLIFLYPIWHLNICISFQHSRLISVVLWSLLWASCNILLVLSLLYELNKIFDTHWLNSSTES